jgi:hypothetical protein
MTVVAFFSPAARSRAGRWHGRSGAMPMDENTADHSILPMCKNTVSPARTRAEAQRTLGRSKYTLQYVRISDGSGAARTSCTLRSVKST